MGEGFCRVGRVVTVNRLRVSGPIASLLLRARGLLGATPNLIGESLNAALQRSVGADLLTSAHFPYFRPLSTT